MKIIKDNRSYTDLGVRLRRVEDLQSKEKVTSIISLINALEQETGVPYRLVRMQQRILEIWGIFPEDYNAQDRVTFVLNRYSINDLRIVRNQLGENISSHL